MLRCSMHLSGECQERKKKRMQMEKQNTKQKLIVDVKTDLKLMTKSNKTGTVYKIQSE